VAILILFLLVTGAAAQDAGTVRGIVVDIRGGEPLARVRVKLPNAGLATVTDEAGQFAITAVPSGDHALHVSTVGYRLLKEPFSLAADETKEFEVVLSPDTFRHADSVEVRADPFATIRSDSPSELVIEGDEVKNLASVLSDDPLRAVQAMPGVSSNDDFNSFFSIRAADYHRVGVYLDGILLHMPFHMVVEDNPTGSLTAFNGDTAESIALHSGAYPARYPDRTGAAIDVKTREGSRTGIFIRATASFSNAGVMAEGPIGKKGSWLASYRKSYLQYLIDSVSDSNDNNLAFGFWDVQGKVGYDLSRKHHVTLGFIQGQSDLDQFKIFQRLGRNSIMQADYQMTLATASWQYTPTASLLLDNRLAYMREKHHNINKQWDDLERGYYGEWVWNANGSWRWRENAALDFGVNLRRLRDDGFWNFYVVPYEAQRFDDYSGRAIRAGGYAQQSWQTLQGRLQFSGGARWDRHETNGISSLTPHASVAFHPFPKTQLRLGWGQYVQHPELKLFYMRIGRDSLAPERSNHLLASVEQRLDERTRLRIEAWNRDDRDLLARPLADPRTIDGEVVRPPLHASIENSVRGYSRGFEVMVQRRSANRLSGWVSYAYGRTGMRDGVTADRYEADRDQLHTVNIYGTYRLRPTINLSAKWLYGSGYPLTGYFHQDGNKYFLTEVRNALRTEDYHRLDIRVNKAFIFQRWKMTLYAEVINVYNRDNRRFDDLRSYNPNTGQARLRFYDLFPILPSAGIVFEFGH
jgi:carboxypeptidase-like protein